MTSKEGCHQAPSLETSEIMLKDMINEYSLQVVATVLGVTHVPDIVWASLESFTTKLVVVSEFLQKCSFCDKVIWVVRDSKRADSDFCTENHEVS